MSEAIIALSDVVLCSADASDAVRSYFVYWRFVIQRYDNFLPFTPPTFWELLLRFGEQTAILFMQLW